MIKALEDWTGKINTIPDEYKCLYQRILQEWNKINGEFHLILYKQKKIVIFFTFY